MLHNSQKDFLKRHIGPSDEDQNKMLKELNYKSLDDLIKSTVPEKIQLKDELNIRGLDDIHIVVGGVIPKEDFIALLDSGASAIFATGTNIVDAAAELLNILEIK